MGRPRLTARGWWSAAVLLCGGQAVLSHQSAAQLWGIRKPKTGSQGEQDRPPVIDVSVPGVKSHRRSGIRIHRRRDLEEVDRIRYERIPVTSPSRTLLDLAPLIDPSELEAAVNAADKLGLVDPDSLRADIEEHTGMIGLPALRRVLDRHTFALTDSGAGAALLAAPSSGKAAEAGDPATSERVPRRFPLGCCQGHRRDRRPAVPPDARSAGKKSEARPSAGCRWLHRPEIHPRPGLLRPRACGGDAARRLE